MIRSAPTASSSQTVAPPRADARWCAFQLLSAVLHQHRALDDLLEASRDLTLLEPRDRGFARALVAISLRRLGILDAVLARCLREPIKPRDLAAMDLLRLGAAQLLYLGTPAHAAVSATVALADPAGVPHLKGLINAILRRLARDGAALLSGIDAERATLPAWLWRSWTGTYGEAVTRQIVRGLWEEPTLDITARAEPDRWAAALEATVLPTGSLRRTGAGIVPDLPGFAEGAWWVQDAAAALPARLFGTPKGLKIADLCAAPGGKTLQLAAAGAQVVALDRSDARLDRLRRNFERTHLTADVLAADAAEWKPGPVFDGVLLDAPCSSTGTIRRHPDVLHLKKPEDVDKLTATQDRLLDAAADMLKPGGVLVYCVCSLEEAEGPDRVRRFLARDRRFARKPIRPAEIAAADGGANARDTHASVAHPDLAAMVTRAGDLRTLPSHFADLGGIDGFFAARLQRIS